jgi:mannosylglycoprotein endo-beta-mannosidase
LAHATFGVPTISSFTHPTTKLFSLRVNGHPVFLAGGDWITTDQFLRHLNSPRGYLHELGLLRHSGINAVRVWGGGVAETDDFYDAADLLGMLVYQEFWMMGDNNGRFAGSHEWPIDRRV